MSLNNMNSNSEDISNNINFDNLPKPEDIHNHLDGILDGKIGALAKEIADETTKDLNIMIDQIISNNLINNLQLAQILFVPTLTNAACKNTSKKYKQKTIG